MSKDQKKELPNTPPIDKLIDELDFNQTAAADASSAKIENMSFSILSMMFGDLKPNILWKMVALIDNLQCVEESVTMLCLLTDYVSRECTSLGLCDMINELSSRWSGNGPTNYYKQLAATWNKVLLKAKSDLKDEPYNCLVDNLESYIRTFKSHGLDRHFTDTLEMAYILKKHKHVSDVDPYEYVETIIPHLPSSATVPNRTLMKVWCASSRYCPLYDEKYRKHVQKQNKKENKFKWTNFSDINLDREFAGTVQDKVVCASNKTETCSVNQDISSVKRRVGENAATSELMQEKNTLTQLPSKESKDLWELNVPEINADDLCKKLDSIAKMGTKSSPVFIPKFKKTIDSKLKQKKLAQAPEKEDIKFTAKNKLESKINFWKKFDEFDSTEDEDSSDTETDKSSHDTSQKIQDSLDEIRECIKDIKSTFLKQYQGKDEKATFSSNTSKSTYSPSNLVTKNDSKHVKPVENRPRLYSNKDKLYSPPTKSCDSTFKVSWSTSLANKPTRKRMINSDINDGENELICDEITSADLISIQSFDKRTPLSPSKSAHNIERNIQPVKSHQKDIRFFSKPFSSSPSPRKRVAVSVEDESPRKSPRLSLSFDARI